MGAWVCGCTCVRLTVCPCVPVGLCVFQTSLPLHVCVVFVNDRDNANLRFLFYDNAGLVEAGAAICSEQDRNIMFSNIFELRDVHLGFLKVK